MVRAVGDDPVGQFALQLDGAEAVAEQVVQVAGDADALGVDGQVGAAGRRPSRSQAAGREGPAGVVVGGEAGGQARQQQCGGRGRHHRLAVRGLGEAGRDDGRDEHGPAERGRRISRALPATRPATPAQEWPKSAYGSTSSAAWAPSARWRWSVLSRRKYDACSTTSTAKSMTDTTNSGVSPARSSARVRSVTQTAAKTATMIARYLGIPGDAFNVSPKSNRSRAKSERHAVKYLPARAQAEY